MYHVFHAWEVNVLINNEQSLKTTVELVAKLAYGSIILSI